MCLPLDINFVLNLSYTGADSTENILFGLDKYSSMFTRSKLLCGFHGGENTCMAGKCMHIDILLSDT